MAAPAGRPSRRFPKRGACKKIFMRHPMRLPAGQGGRSTLVMEPPSTDRWRSICHGTSGNFSLAAGPNDGKQWRPSD